MSGPASTHGRIYQVFGLTSSRGVESITAEVEALDPVTDVHVEPATGDVTVRSTRPLTDAEMVAAIEEAGFDLRG